MDIIRAIISSLVFIVGYIIGFSAILFIIAWPFMLVWNAVIPNITNNSLTPLSYWQSVGVIIISTFLFRGCSVQEYSCTK